MSDGKKQEIILQADTPEELATKLAKLDIHVPPLSERKKGRKNHTNERRERYCIAHLLATLLASAKLYFPLTLYKQQSPDFMLSMTSNKIGIEHTEAVSKNVIGTRLMWAEEDRVRKQKNLPPKIHFFPHSTPGEPSKKKEELQNDIKNADALLSHGWAGDSHKHEWATAIANSIEKKLYTAQKQHFTLYPTNWLIVFDNWLVPFFEYAEAASYLIPYLENMNAFAVFDAIFVHDSSQMCEFSKSGAIIHSLVKPNISELCPV